MHLEMLTDDERIASLCEDYWRLNDQGAFELKIKEIAIKYEMKLCAVTKFSEKHAFIRSNEAACRSCGKAFCFFNRTQYINRNMYRDYKCSACEEMERRAIAEEKKALILKVRQTAESAKASLSSLDLKSKVYLLAVIQALGDERVVSTQPLDNYAECTLSPNYAYDQQILGHLVGEHILLPSLNNDLNVIERYDDGQARIDLGLCEFDIASDQEQVAALISYFFDHAATSDIRRMAEFSELCREIQLHECLAFLRLVIAQHQLSFSPGDKTMLTLNKCLESYSVAQVYCFIWRAGRDAAAYYMRRPIGKTRAGNSVVRNISRSRERAIANDWEISSFHRNYNLPQSALSRVVFNVILGTDDGGFQRPLQELIG